MWDNHRLLRIMANTMLILVVSAVLYVVSQQFIKPIFFPLKQINIYSAENANSGLQYVSHEEIEQLVKNHIKGNFFSVDLTAVQEIFAALPWVRHANVAREWPYGLTVTLEEHHPLAYWGSNALVNTHGEVFRVELDQQLPVFTGPMEASSQEVAENYQKFSKILAPLAQSIAKIHLSHRYAWRIHLETGTVLELGRDKVEERLRRYVSVYDSGLVQIIQQETLAHIDLRYPNGFAVRLPEVLQQMPRVSGTGKQT